MYTWRHALGCCAVCELRSTQLHCSRCPRAYHAACLPQAACAAGSCCPAAGCCGKLGHGNDGGTGDARGGPAGHAGSDREPPGRGPDTPEVKRTRRAPAADNRAAAAGRVRQQPARRCGGWAKREGEGGCGSRCRCRNGGRLGLTPDWLIWTAAFRVLGLRRPTAAEPYIPGLLDPCTNCKEHPNIPGQELYDRADDGLDERNSWAGRAVLLNPEFNGDVQWRFVNRVINEVEACNVPAAVLICRASTDTAFWQRLRPYPRVLLDRHAACFKDYDKAPIGFGIALFCLVAPNQPAEGRLATYRAFLREFGAWGEACIPCDAALVDSPEFVQIMDRNAAYAAMHLRHFWVECTACREWRMISAEACRELAREGPDAAWTCGQLGGGARCKAADRQNKTRLQGAAATSVPARTAVAAAAAGPVEGGGGDVRPAVAGSCGPEPSMPQRPETAVVPGAAESTHSDGMPAPEEGGAMRAGAMANTCAVAEVAVAKRSEADTSRGQHEADGVPGSNVQLPPYPPMPGTDAVLGAAEPLQCGDGPAVREGELAPKESVSGAAQSHRSGGGVPGVQHRGGAAPDSRMPHLQRALAPVTAAVAAATQGWMGQGGGGPAAQAFGASMGPVATTAADAARGSFSRCGNPARRVPDGDAVGRLQGDAGRPVVPWGHGAGAATQEAGQVVLLPCSAVPPTMPAAAAAAAPEEDEYSVQAGTAPWPHAYAMAATRAAQEAASLTAAVSLGALQEALALETARAGVLAVQLLELQRRYAAEQQACAAAEAARAQEAAGSAALAERVLELQNHLAREQRARAMAEAAAAAAAAERDAALPGTWGQEAAAAQNLAVHTGLVGEIANVCELAAQGGRPSDNMACELEGAAGAGQGGAASATRRLACHLPQACAINMESDGLWPGVPELQPRLVEWLAPLPQPGQQRPSRTPWQLPM